jgi:4-amino-4-deoxy-L-arabinose transferase-like glycosyltransferase
MNLAREGIQSRALVLLVGSLAFVRLMALPVFEDEGTQQRLIWRLLEHGEWLQALVDGKPLEVWLMAPFALLGRQPVQAVRAVHVVCGLLAALLTYRLAFLSVDRATARMSGLLFAICPMTVYLERLALADILLCAASTWVLAASMRFVEAPARDRALRLGAALTLAALCKLPVGFVVLSAIPLALLLMPAWQRQPLLLPPVRGWLLRAHVPTVLLGMVVLLVAVFRWRHGHTPGFGVQDLVGVGGGGAGDIGAAMGVPRPSLTGELGAQLTPMVMVLGMVGVFASVWLGDWRQRWLTAVGLLPLLAIGLGASFWFSRYLLFALPPLTIAAVAGWRTLSARAGRWGPGVRWAVLATCVAVMGYQSALLVFDPAAARWSAVDRFQYIEGWGSGYGYPEAAQFLLAASPPPMVFSLDGHSAYQLRNYLPSRWRARVQPAIYGAEGTLLRSDAARLDNLLSHAPVWIIAPAPLLHGSLNANFGSGADKLAVRPIAAFQKPGNHGPLGLYEVGPRADR